MRKLTVPTRAPRRTNSRHRIPGSGRATFVSARRIPGRRKPTWGTWSSVVDPLDAQAQAAHDLPRDRSDCGRHLSHIDALIVLSTDNHNLVAGRHIGPGHVGHQHVHADRSNDARAPAANQYAASTGESEVQ